MAKTYKMNTTEIIGDLVLFSSSGDDVRLVGRREVVKKSSLDAKGREG